MFISCDYNDGGSPQEILSSYKGFVVTEDDKKTTVFFSSDPVKDYAEARAYIKQRVTQTGEHVMMSSSVDHFISDCNGVFGWYIDANGIDMFDLTEKVEALEAQHKEERTKRSTAVWDLLKKLGVPTETAKDDTIAMFHHCSEATFVALSKHYESLK